MNATESLFHARLRDVRARLELAEAALVHTQVFKADGLVADARWLLLQVERLANERSTS